MFKQIKLLSWLLSCNTFGRNEVKYTKDKSKKVKLIVQYALMIYVFVCVGVYSVLSGVGLSAIDQEDNIPMATMAIASMIMLIFSIVKAGSTLFNTRTYEMQISLPVSRTAIVLSRYYSLYKGNIGLLAMFMIPSAIYYAVRYQPSASYYIFTVLGFFLIPLLPITISTAIGVIILAISSRVKHKNIVSIILNVIFIVAIFGISGLVSYKAVDFTKSEVSSFFADVISVLKKVYYPSKLYGDAVVEGDILQFLLFAVLSIGVSAIVLYIVAKYYQKISSAMQSTTAKRSYELKEMEIASPLKTLYRKELKRYFSSMIYVINTSVGYILMLILCIAAPIVGVDRVAAEINISGIDSMSMIIRMFPYIMSIFAVMMPTTACCISMEGKQWWILQSLPVKTKTIYLAKIMVNLSVAAPFYVVSEIIMLCVLKTNIMEALWLILIPGVTIVFSSVVSLFINILIPNFTWENETQAVKQGGAGIVSMLVNSMFLGLFAVIVLFIPDRFVNITCAIEVVLMGIVSYGLLVVQSDRKIQNIQ